MDYIRTLSREFDVGGRLELSMDNRSGAISVRGEETNAVRLEVIAHLWAEDEDEADDQLDLIARGIRHEGQRLTIRAPALLRPKPFLFFGRGPQIEYQLVVPRTCKASITSRSGRVEVESISGPVELVARSGRASAREIGGDVQVNASSGSTQLEAIGGDVTIESRSGGVRVTGCKGRCSIKARSGSLQLENTGGDLEIDTRSGSTSITNASGALKMTANSGSVRYDGPVRGSISIEVWSGSIRLTVDMDSVFFLDAESSSGSVRSDLPMRNKSSAPPADAPKVRLRTRSGGIVIGPR
jgi:hypothetical protein